MTTIAYRDGVLAADRLITQGDARFGYTRKVALSPAGHIGGAAGGLHDVESFLRWIDGGCEDDPPDVTSSDEPTGILVMPDGTINLWNGHSVLVPVRGPFVADGSGWKLAIGAMAAGASAIQAVEIASLYDTGTGGGIDSVTLPRRARKKG